MRARALVALVPLLILGACREEQAAIPGPVPLTADALSHFCQMQVIEHGGPKAQIHLEGHAHPLFFAQVRDGIAYLKGPERTAAVVAVYVSDMGAAPSWAEPGAENWIPADLAHFVVGAAVTGGMGAPEIAPFLSRTAAEGFAGLKGGSVMALGQIPDAAVFSAIEISLPKDDPS